MATAIRSVEANGAPGALRDLAGYRQALVLVRWNGRPLGQLRLPVVAGEVPPEVFRRALADLATSVEPTEAADPGRLPPATVAICTRDRPRALLGCLEALSRLPDDGQEVLVVDNHPSTSASRQIATRFPQVRYMVEPKPGLSAARNRALREASRPVVAFTDDDARPDPGWLRSLLPSFADPRVLCVTGLTMPLELETPAQEWFQARFPYGRGFSRVVFERGAGGLPPPGRPGAGVNMALRRDVLARVGPFDECLGPGTPARSGDDNDMFTRVLRAGYRIAYEPAALVWHQDRRDWTSLRRLLFGYRAGLFAGWTRDLLAERDYRALWLAAHWLVGHQTPVLLRALRGPWPDRRPDLRLAELFGCLFGPWAYLYAAAGWPCREKRR